MTDWNDDFFAFAEQLGGGAKLVEFRALVTNGPVITMSAADLRTNGFDPPPDGVFEMTLTYSDGRQIIIDEGDIRFRKLV